MLSLEGSRSSAQRICGYGHEVLERAKRFELSTPTLAKGGMVLSSWSAPVHGNSPESAVVRGTKGCSIRTGVNPSERLKTRMKASDSNRAVTR